MVTFKQNFFAVYLGKYLNSWFTVFVMLFYKRWKNLFFSENGGLAFQGTPATL